MTVTRELFEAAEYAVKILAKVPAFGDSIGKCVSKAQIGLVHARLANALKAAQPKENKP